MKKILALGFLGLAYADPPSCTTGQKNAGECYEDSADYKLAKDKTITHLVLTEITSADPRHYTGDDVDQGKYGISYCDGSSDPKTWGTQVDGNVVECESVYNNLASDLSRQQKTLTGVGGGTYHRILVGSTDTLCNTLSGAEIAAVCTGDYTGDLIADAGATCDGSCDATDAAACCVPKASCSTLDTSLCAGGLFLFTGDLIDNADATKCATDTCLQTDAETCCQITCGSGKYNTAVAGEQINCVPWSICSAGEHESNAPSAIQNRQCADNECTCPGGVKAEGAACTDHEHEICTDCDNNKFLSGGKCKASVTGFKSFAARKTAMKTKEALKTVGVRTDSQVEAAVLERFQKIQAAMELRTLTNDKYSAPDFSAVTCDDVNGHPSKKCIRDALQDNTEMRVKRGTVHVKILNRGDKRETIEKARGLNRNKVVKMSKYKDKIEFDMETNGDMQIIEISKGANGQNDIDCVLTSAAIAGDINCVFEVAGITGEDRRRLTGASGCFTGSATLNADGSYSFDPATILIDKTCSVTAVEDGEDVSYNVVPCNQNPQTYTGDNRIEASAVYTADTSCSVCAPGDGLVNTRTHIFGHNGDEHYTYNNEDDPDITIVSGVKHTFERSSSGHSLIIITEEECDLKNCSTGWSTLPTTTLATVSFGSDPLEWTPTVGIYYYVCSAHSAMYGKITVTANAGECEVCDNDPHPDWNNAFDHSQCGIASQCGLGQGVLTAATDTANTQCEACLVGNSQYSDDDDYTACKDCSELTCSDIQFEQLCTNTADGQCVNCAIVPNSVAGSQRCSAVDPSGITAITCEAGFYKTGTAGSNLGCSSCSGADGIGDGDGWSTSGASSCTNFITCHANANEVQSGSATEARTCACKAGYNDDNGDGTSCTDINECDGHACSGQGTCTHEIGETSAGKFTCACSAGFWGGGDNTDTCTECDANSIGCNGLSKGQCDAGYSGDGASCAQCESGTYKDVVGNANCAPCGQGTYSDSGASVCTTCVDGNSATLLDNADAQAVPSGAKFCVPCAIGKADTDGHAHTTCSVCDPGFVQPETGKTSCAECTLGKYDDGSETEICATCAEGKFAADKVTACAPCAAGYYQSGVDNDYKCEECKDGRITNTLTETGATTCDLCPGFGKVAADSTSQCLDCPVKTFQHPTENKDNYVCEACTDPSPGVVGNYTSEVGQSACKSCSLFSTEWINTQCCSDSTQCGHLSGQCGTTC
jgi:plastocyanin